MTRKHVLTMSFLFPLIAMSSIANAGIGVSDKRYWPNEVGPGAYRTDRAQGDWNSRRAPTKRTLPYQVAPKVNNGQPKCGYLGGAHSTIVC